MERPLAVETPLAVEVPLTEVPLAVEVPLTVEAALIMEAPQAVAMPLTANAMVDKTLRRRRTRVPPAPMVLDFVFIAGPPHQIHSFALSAA